MAHNPVNHPLRPLYRVLGGLSGLYVLLFGVLLWKHWLGVPRSIGVLQPILFLLLIGRWLERKAQISLEALQRLFRNLRVQQVKVGEHTTWAAYLGLFKHEESWPCLREALRQASHTCAEASADKPAIFLLKAGGPWHMLPRLDPVRANPLPGQTQAHVLLRHTGDEMPGSVNV